MIEIEDKIKKALIKDFKNLFVMEFSTNWRAERIKAELEIEVMSLDNLEAVIAESNREYGLKLLEQVEVDLRRLMREHDGLKSSDRLVLGNMVIESIAGFRLKIKKENGINP